MNSLADQSNLPIREQIKYYEEETIRALAREGIEYDRTKRRVVIPTKLQTHQLQLNW